MGILGTSFSVRRVAGVEPLPTNFLVGVVIDLSSDFDIMTMLAPEAWRLSTIFAAFFFWQQGKVMWYILNVPIRECLAVAFLVVLFLLSQSMQLFYTFVRRSFVPQRKL